MDAKNLVREEFANEKTTNGLMDSKEQPADPYAEVASKGPVEVIEIEDDPEEAHVDWEDVDDEDEEEEDAFDDTESLLMDVLNEEFDDTLDSKSTNSPLLLSPTLYHYRTN